MTTPPSDPREALAEVLLAHRYLRGGTINGAPAPGWCSCGSRWFDSLDRHADHVADHLARLLADREAEALERAADELVAEQPERRTEAAHGKIDAARWLRARAQEVRRQ